MQALGNRVFAECATGGRLPLKLQLIDGLARLGARDQDGAGIQRDLDLAVVGPINGRVPQAAREVGAEQRGEAMGVRTHIVGRFGCVVCNEGFDRQRIAWQRHFPLVASAQTGRTHCCGFEGLQPLIAM